MTRLTIVGSDHKCLICGKGDSDKPICYQKEDWCSELHRQLVDGERTPTPYEESSMWEGVLLRSGRGPLLFFGTVNYVFDADDDEYWPEETRTVFPVEK